ncbi:MAG: hypothetical protein ACE5K4_09550 [Candidatus Hydrothermarchaeota archaeon]
MKKVFLLLLISVLSISISYGSLYITNPIDSTYVNIHASEKDKVIVVKEGLNAQQNKLLLQLKRENILDRIYIVGGPAVLPYSLEREVYKITGLVPIRIWGATRSETSAFFSRSMYPYAKHLIITDWEEYTNENVLKHARDLNSPVIAIRTDNLSPTILNTLKYYSKNANFLATNERVRMKLLSAGFNSENLYDFLETRKCHNITEAMKIAEKEFDMRISKYEVTGRYFYFEGYSTNGEYYKLRYDRMSGKIIVLSKYSSGDPEFLENLNPDRPISTCNC